MHQGQDPPLSIHASASMPLTPFREPDFTSEAGTHRRSLSAGPSGFVSERRPQMAPLLLWILGVPGLIILLLLLLGVVHI
jgi:hypothetical protein